MTVSTTSRLWKYNRVPCNKY